LDDSGGWGGLAIDDDDEEEEDEEEEEEEEAESNLPLSRSRYLISELEPQSEVKYSENS
jgi:nucleosome binding factor SPN SPT16 subunit